MKVRHVPDGMWQPVAARRMRCGCYLILGASNDPEHEYWEFSKGSKVCCAAYEFSAGEVGLIAVRACYCPVATTTSEPKSQKS